MANINNKFYNVFNNVSYIILEYLGSIYDMSNLSLTCHDYKDFLRNEKNSYSYRKLIVDTNLEDLFKNEFKIDYLQFQSFCKTTGLILAGSTMLRAITGPGWAKPFDNKSVKLPINDIDLHLDYNSDTLELTLSEILKYHDITFVQHQIRCFASINYLTAFLNKYKQNKPQVYNTIWADIRKKTMQQFNNILPNMNSASNDDYEKIFIIMLDCIYNNKTLLSSLNDTKSTTIDDLLLLQQDNINNHNILYSTNVQNLVVNLEKIGSTGISVKIQLIIGSFPTIEQTLSHYDFKFLGAYIKYTDESSKQKNNVNFRQTISHILNRNKNNEYEHHSLHVNDKTTIKQEKLNETQLIKGQFFLLNMNMNPNNTENTGIVNIFNYNQRQLKYCKRLTSYYQASYQRMKKYYERGFYTFTDLNINNEDFKNDIETLTPVEFVNKHVSQLHLKLTFNKMLTK